MAAIFVRVTNTTYASRTNTDVPVPAGTANGRTLVLIHVVGASAADPPTASGPPGFALLPGFPVTVADGADFRLTVRAWFKTALSESGSFYTVTHSTAPSQGMMLLASGSIGSPPQVTVNTGTGGVTTALGLTTLAPDSLIAFVGQNWNLYGAADPPAGSTPTFTERSDEGTSLLYLATGGLSAPGATGNKTHSNGNLSSEPWTGLLIEIPDAANGVSASDSSYVTSGYVTDGYVQSDSVHGAGQSLALALGASAGTAAAVAAGQSLALALGASAGMAAAVATGQSLALALGASAGTAAAVAAGQSLALALGASAGTAAAVAAGQSLALAAGASAGSAAAAAAGRALALALGQAYGAASCLGLAQTSGGLVFTLRISRGAAEAVSVLLSPFGGVEVSAGREASVEARLAPSDAAQRLLCNFTSARLPAASTAALSLSLLRDIPPAAGAAAGSSAILGAGRALHESTGLAAGTSTAGGFQ